MDKQQNILYKKLNKKYPNEFTWIEKYLDTNLVHTITELGMVAQSELYNLYSVWYYDLTLDDCKLIITNGFGFTTSIFLKTGFKHSVCVIGFDDINNLLIIHDPLGDYFTNYIIWYGAYVEFPYDKFLKISTGNPINAQIFFPNKNISKKVLKNINKKKYAYP